MKKIILVAFVAVGFASCKTSQKVSYNDYSTISLPKPEVITKPIIADLEIGAKTSTTQTFTNSLLGPAREASLAQFCKEHKCDVVVHPIFDIETETKEGKTLRNKVNVKLTGFPGSYKNLRNYEAKDSASFNNNIYSHVNVASAASYSQSDIVKPPKRHKKGLIVLGSAVGVALLALLLL